jgi:hypothetical protein
MHVEDVYGRLAEDSLSQSFAKYIGSFKKDVVHGIPRLVPPNL